MPRLKSAMPLPVRSPRPPQTFPRLIALLLAGGSFVAIPACVQPPTSGTPPASSSSSAPADEEYRALIAKDRERIVTGAPADPEAQRNRAQARFIFMHERGLAFIEKYPADPRRWDVLVLLPHGRDHEKRTLESGEQQLVPVTASLEQWEQRYYPMLEALIVARDAGREARSQALRQLITYHSRRVQTEPPENNAATVTKVQGWLRTFQLEFYDSGALLPLYHRVAGMLTLVDPVQCRVFLNELYYRHDPTGGVNHLIHEEITGRQRVLDGIAKPVDSLWTQLKELDPTFRDLSRYRGKVVLIVMGPVSWPAHSTLWEKLYAKYHAEGFEIVQIVPHNPGGLGSAAEHDKAAMEKFVAAKGWPWRVVWDPKGYHQDFAASWGQQSYPSYLLIGRNGRIINYRGEPNSYAAHIPAALAASPSP